MSNQLIKDLEQFEDRIRLNKQFSGKENQYSKYCDFIYYSSSVTPELTLAMRVLKPEKPSYILAGTHGWHMSIPKFEEYTAPQSEYLQVQIDMRGRAFSDGKPDCNGLELIDIIDAIEYVKDHYSEYILDKEVIYFLGGSGGGGNALALAGKFPDYFTHLVCRCVPYDYALWHQNDSVGEFQDEMDIWIGDISSEMAYASRSGITFVENLCSPMVIVHGACDIRVPEYQSSNYVAKAKQYDKDHLIKYIMLPGIGGEDHFVNMSKEHMEAITSYYENDRLRHTTPVQIPRKGKMIIGGYLYTKHFSIMLNSVDKVAEIAYDLDSNSYHVTGVSEEEYVLTLK